VRDLRDAAVRLRQSLEGRCERVPDDSEALRPAIDSLRRHHSRFERCLVELGTDRTAEILGSRLPALLDRSPLKALSEACDVPRDAPATELLERVDRLDAALSTLYRQLSRTPLPPGAAEFFANLAVLGLGISTRL
jgi:hypothetical protein